jgi:hypothetical protein
MYATLQAVDRQRATAWFFLAFSTAYGLRILLSMPASVREQAAFYSLGVVALSVGRLMGVRNPVPCPELLLLAADRIKILCLTSYKAPAADEFLLAFDRNFGYAEMWVGRLFHLVPMVGRFFETLYFGEMLAIPLLYVALPAEARKKYGAAVILIGAIIPLLYRLCPGAGPGYLLPNFPFAVPTLLHPHARMIEAALNTTPSGHFAWALLMFWFACRYAGRGVRIAAGCFAVAMAIATLGTGEHYVIDLVVSVPFTAAIWAAVHDRYRWAAIAMAVTAVWCVGLRDGAALSIAPGWVWMLTAGTIAPFALYGAAERRVL